MIIIKQKTMKEIVQRYGRAHARAYDAYDAAGIPQRYWDSKTRAALESRNALIAAGSLTAGSAYLSVHAMYDVDRHKRVAMVRLDELIATVYGDKWQTNANREVLAELGTYSVLYIHGLRESMLEDEKTAARFVYILDALNAHGEEKRIYIAGFVPDGEDPEAVYEDLLRYMRTELSDVEVVTVEA